MGKTRRRFKHKYRKLQNGCWRWTGPIQNTGYGHVHYKGKHTTAHRAAYQEVYGPISNNLEVDHLCGNRWCVNPRHLEAVTRRENLRRAREGPNSKWAKWRKRVEDLREKGPQIQEE